MKTIRQSVFETNSSSSHSLSICHNTTGMYDTIPPDENGVISLTGGEFGWGYEKYNDPYDKACYIAVGLMASEMMNAPEYDRFISLMKEHTGAKEIIFNFSTNWKDDNNSYIDHQSSYAFREAFDSDQDLKDFLFNRGSQLIIDNDNH